MSDCNTIFMPAKSAGRRKAWMRVACAPCGVAGRRRRCVTKGIEPREQSHRLDFTTYLPAHRGLFYGGEWHEPRGGYLETFNPATGESLGQAAEADEADVDAAVEAAHRA